MKIIKIYCLTILLIFNFIIPKHSYAQDNDGLWGALAAGAIAGAIAIEDNKEYLESLASNIIFSNYPEYNEFRIKTLGWGDGAKRLSDKGKVNLYPFALTKLKNTLPTENRKLLLLFASPGWINEYGLDYTKLRWELWSLEDWNKCMSYFTELNSPINIPIVAIFFFVQSFGFKLFSFAAFSAGRPKASHPIGCRTLNPFIILYLASTSPIA